MEALLSNILHDNFGFKRKKRRFAAFLPYFKEEERRPATQPPRSAREKGARAPPPRGASPSPAALRPPNRQSRGGRKDGNRRARRRRAQAFPCHSSFSSRFRIFQHDSANNCIISALSCYANKFKQYRANIITGECYETSGKAQISAHGERADAASIGKKNSASGRRPSPHTKTARTNRNYTA